MWLLHFQKQGISIASSKHFRFNTTLENSMSLNIREMSTAALLTMLCGDVGNALAGRSLIELFGMNQTIGSCNQANEDRAQYQGQPVLLAAKELYVRAMAEAMSMRSCFSNPKLVRDFLVTQIGNLEHEVFGVIFLNAQLRMISFEILFTGTLSQTSVYPREVVKRALSLNCGSVIFAHNHPSGETLPSQADQSLTRTLKQALALVDVRVVDHVVVSGNASTSMAEIGLV
jgi:DNA repair protein RadC